MFKNLPIISSLLLPKLSKFAIPFELVLNFGFEIEWVKLIESKCSFLISCKLIKVFGEFNPLFFGVENSGFWLFIVNILIEPFFDII